MRHRPLFSLISPLLVPLLVASAPAHAEDAIFVLFVGNSYTFARVDPVLTYNAAKVRDLTRPQGDLRWQMDPSVPYDPRAGAPFTDVTGTNSYPVGSVNPVTGALFDSYSPRSQTHAWSGVAGIFEKFTSQAGLNYDVALSSRNAATLRGHFLNAGSPNWDMRGNIASKAWNQVVLQEQSSEPLTRQPGLGANPEYSRFYADKIENFVHSTTASGVIRDRDAFPGSTSAQRQAACEAAGIAAGTCSNNRGTFANPFGSASTEMYLFQTWARPNLINAPGAIKIDPASGNASYEGTPPPAFYPSLEAMTADLKGAYEAIKDRADDDGTPGFKAIAPVGETFLRAVQTGVATRDMYAAGAQTDGLIDLWFNDGTHASVHGSYLAALTLFGTLTGRDPAMLGASEIAARDLGISPADALALQRVASDQLGYTAPIPEPSTVSMLGLGLLGMGALARSRRRAAAQG
jgi:hypothetical protein